MSRISETLKLIRKLRTTLQSAPRKPKPLRKMTERTEERMLWITDYLLKTPNKHCVAWDEEVVDAFVKAFPEAKKALRVYTLGSNSSPMMNRAAQAAYQRGYIRPGRIGNQYARDLNQRTWARTWRLIKNPRTGEIIKHE